MTSWVRESCRVAILLIGASGAALGMNALSRRPVPLLDPAGPGSWAERERRMTVDDLGREWSRGRPMVLLDVRSPDLTKKGRPRRCLQIPAVEFMRHYASQNLSSVLTAADGIVVMCGSDACPQADVVAASLRRLGHRDVWVLQGGWEAYQDGGLECVRP